MIPGRPRQRRRTRRGSIGPVRPTLTRRLAGFGTTIFTEMTRLATEHGAINLAQGFPDFDGPDFAKAAAIDAIGAGLGQYARASGAPALHTRLAERYRARYDLAFEPGSEFVVGCGATELIFAAVQALCDVGDEVVLFEPFYDSYRASVCMAGATPRVVTLHRPGFHLDMAELERAFSERTRLVLINTPHNPTGKVFGREELEAIAALCRRHDVVCVADEVYEELVYDGKHIPMATLPGMRERTVTISSMSKAFSLTGWRVGWAAAPAPLAAALACAHQFITFSAPTPLQHAAAAALGCPDAYFDELRAGFRARRDYLVAALRGAGFSVEAPAGAYFVCAGIERFGFADDVEFCRYLTKEIGVAAIPPSAFYERGHLASSFVRFVFCKRDETLRAAGERLARLVPG
jgi:N-succinyldiaminopimelate aminotransferase